MATNGVVREEKFIIGVVVVRDRAARTPTKSRGRPSRPRASTAMPLRSFA